MTIQNQCLVIPPAHPLATELNDLIGLQFVLLEQGDDGQALAIVGNEIDILRDKFRKERGADESCSVSLTYDTRGAPIVQRPGGPILTVI